VARWRSRAEFRETAWPDLLRNAAAGREGDTPQDASFVFDMYSREDVQTYLGRPLQTIEEASQRVERWRTHYAYDRLHGAWAVTLRDTGQIVGTVALKRASLSADVPQPSGENPVGDLPLSDDYEVGWHLHPDQWGHGYATEASSAALQRAFDAGIPELIALIDPDNVRSRLVAGRLGMQYVGRTRRYESKELDLFLARPV
jgi:RimJ/RimL family protein N-acetyltransferase